MAAFPRVPGPLVIGVSVGGSFSLAVMLGFRLLDFGRLVRRDFIFLRLAEKLVLVGTFCFHISTSSSSFRGIAWARGI